MQKGSILIFLITGLFFVTILVGSFYIWRLKFIAPKPQTTTVQPTSKPIIIHSPPISSPSADLFKNPNEPAYIPGKGFAPDAKRVLDITSLRISLERYYFKNKIYPLTLSELFPDFAPKDENDLPLTSPSLDPITKQSYEYLPDTDRQSYQLTTVLDSGKEYSIKSIIPK